MKYFVLFIAENLVSLFACIGLFVVMKMKSRIGGKKVWPLRAGIISLMLLVVSEYCDYQMELVTYGGGWRYFTSTLNYIIRPLQCMFLVLQVKNSKKWNLALGIPWIIYTLLMLINLPTHIIFYFNPDFQATLFGNIRIIFPIVYILFVFIAAISSVKDKEVSEVVLLCVLAIAIVIASLIEWIAPYEMGRKIIINPCIAICYIFYYVYLHIAASKRDPLTDLLNRQTFYDDVKNREKDITAVISIDMNDLKLLNDNYGHTVGDEAIATLAKIFMKNRIRGTRVYRIGGDEFLMLSIHATKEEVDSLVDSIYQDVAKTSYSCAIGYSIREKNKSFDDMMIEADHAMYKKKRSMKTTEVR